MKKIYRMKNLECAHCAAKMEERIKRIPGVTDAVVSFMTQRLTLVTECDDQSAIIAEAAKICKKLERDCEIIL